MKSDILLNELNLIKDKNIREWTQATLENAPEYFWVAMASSTGKYHPACTIKKGGLITHVKRTVYLVNRLCGGLGVNGIDQDILISATILHDIAKTPSNDPRYTYADFENHPINAEKYFAKDMELNKDLGTYEMIKDCIRNHMGLWSPKSSIKPLENYSMLELMVYMADYLSATKDLVTPKDGE